MVYYLVTMLLGMLQDIDVSTSHCGYTVVNYLCYGVLLGNYVTRYVETCEPPHYTALMRFLYYPCIPSKAPLCPRTLIGH